MAVISETGVRPVIFLFTDASLCEKTGAGAWAACAIDERVNRVSSGYTPKKIKASSDAEWFALGMGLRTSVQTGFLRPGVELSVGVDHEALLNIRRYAGRSGVRGEVARYARRLMDDLGFEMTMFHVKAHVKASRQDEFQKINARVDRTARERMTERRRQIIRERAHLIPRILEDVTAYQERPAVSIRI